MASSSTRKPSPTHHPMKARSNVPVSQNPIRLGTAILRGDFTQKLLPTLLASWAVCAIAASSTVVGKSADGVVQAADIKAVINLMDPPDRRKLQHDPALLTQVALQELQRQSLLKKARAAKFDARPDVVARMARARDDALISTYLRSVAGPDESYPSEYDIERVYKANVRSFIAPRSYHLAQIFVVSPNDARGKVVAEAKIRQLSAALKKDPTRFADLARTSSEDKRSAPNGGDLGEVAEKEIAEPIRQAVQGLRVGEISEPIDSNGGWHLIKVVDTKRESVRNLTEVRDELASAMRRNRAEQTQNAYLKNMVEREHMSIDESALKAVFESETAGQKVSSR